MVHGKTGSGAWETTPPFGLPAELMSFVRDQFRLGRRVGRAEVMKMFGVTREQIDKARVLAEVEGGAGSVEYRAELARRLMADEAVWVLVNQDVKSSREKRARGRARVVNNDLLANQRALEADLRDLKNADSPFVAGAKAARDLYEAGQLVFAVNGHLDDLPDFSVDEVDDALRDLAKEVQQTLDKISARRAERSNTVAIDDSMVIDAE